MQGGPSTAISFGNGVPAWRPERAEARVIGLEGGGKGKARSEAGGKVWEGWNAMTGKDK